MYKYRCKCCDKIFYPIKKNRVFCSRACYIKQTRKDYANGKRWGKQYDNGHISYKRHLSLEEAQLRKKIRDYSLYHFKYLLNGANCSVCGCNNIIQMHHTKYRYPPKVEDIAILCRKCHIKYDTLKIRNIKGKK